MSEAAVRPWEWPWAKLKIKRRPPPDPGPYWWVRYIEWYYLTSAPSVMVQILRDTARGKITFFNVFDAGMFLYFFSQSRIRRSFFSSWRLVQSDGWFDRLYFWLVGAIGLILFVREVLSP